MIRYLKYIFLIFGSLALAVIGFFIFQNRKDIQRAWDYKERLGYEHVSAHCPQAQDSYYYPCFKQVFEEYIHEAGLTGVSIGMKLAFNFMDEDKASTDLDSEKVKEIIYALNYLELNNIAIEQSPRRFYGFRNMYGGYLSSVRDFLDKAKKFSDNLILGLEGGEGLASLSEGEQKQELQKRFKDLKADYEKIYGEVRGNLDKEIEEFLKKVKEG